MRLFLILALGLSFLPSGFVFGQLPDTITLSQHLKGLGVKLSDRMISEAYRRVGVPLEIEHMPSKRALVFANDGVTDGEAQRIKNINKHYPNLIRVPVAYMWAEQVVLSKNVDFKVDGCESLRPYNIGLRLGVIAMEECTKGMKAISVAKVDQLFYMLDAGRIDVIASGGKLFLLGELSKTNYKGMKVLSPPLKRIPLYHFLHKKHKDFVPVITKVFQAMEKEGYFIRERARAFEELGVED
ncbi:MAG: amino acid ABC transporter substrate-binding protein [Desulfobacteraceae bacterium]|nr:amino acid ABC transporter substrate-binding protein [Desulfobacteraceae bacterium]